MVHFVWGNDGKRYQQNPYTYLKEQKQLQLYQCLCAFNKRISGSWIIGIGKKGNQDGWVQDKGKVRFIRFFQHKGQLNIWQEIQVISIKHKIFVPRLGLKNIITAMAKKNFDSIALKKPLTPFFLYRAEIYDEIKLKNPTLRATELATLIGNMWTKSDSETRSKFEEQYKANKAIYDRQLKAGAEEKSEETEDDRAAKGKKTQKKNKRVVQDEADFDEDEQEDDEEEYDASSKTKKKPTKKTPARKEASKSLPKNTKKPASKKRSTTK